MAARALLAGRDLRRKVITAYIEVAFAWQIRAQRGDDLLVVKANQRDLLWAWETEFGGTH